MPHTTLSVQRDGRILTVAVRTADVETHSVVTEGSRWEFLVAAVRDALTRIADEAKNDRRKA